MTEPENPALTTARALHRSASRLNRRLREARGAEALGGTQMSVLSRLHREGPCTATALAAYLRIQPQSLTRLLAALDARGLIERRVDAQDRRQHEIRITGRGSETMLADIQGRRVRLAQAVGQVLSPTEQGLLRLATELIDRLAETLERGEGE